MKVQNNIMSKQTAISQENGVKNQQFFFLHLFIYKCILGFYTTTIDMTRYDTTMIIKQDNL